MNEVDIEKLSSVAEIFSFTKVFLLIVGIIFLGICGKIISLLGRRFHERLPSQRLLIAQMVTTISFAIYIIGGSYLFYGILEPPRSLLIAVSGTLAVALGLSMKDLVASIVAGIIIIFDRPFQVGDRVTYSGIYGEITSIGLRAVKLLTLDDSVVTIPNSKFITDAVASGNFGAMDMMVEVNFHVDLSSNIVLAKELIYETAATCPYVFLRKPIAIVFDEVPIANRLAMQIRVKAYVLDVRFEKALQTDILARGNQVLYHAGVKRPQLLSKEPLPKTLLS